MLGLIALAAAAGAVAAAGYLTKQTGPRPLDLAAFLAAWSPQHAGIAPTGAVGWWLRRIHPVANSLAKAGVRPAVLTAAGLIAAYGVWAFAALGAHWPLAAAALAAASAGLDGLDGAVALLARRTSRFGGVLDSVADRLAEACFAFALWQLGALPGLVLAAVGLITLFEYCRARAAALGLRAVALITVGERPSRVIAVVLTLIVAGAMPGRGGQVSTSGAAALTGLTLVALVQLLIALARPDPADSC